MSKTVFCVLSHPQDCFLLWAVGGLCSTGDPNNNLAFPKSFEAVRSHSRSSLYDITATLKIHSEIFLFSSCNLLCHSLILNFYVFCWAQMFVTSDLFSYIYLVYHINRKHIKHRKIKVFRSKF